MVRRHDEATNNPELAPKEGQRKIRVTFTDVFKPYSSRNPKILETCQRNAIFCVCFVLKKGHRDIPGNYRLVSFDSVVVKIFKNCFKKSNRGRAGTQFRGTRVVSGKE